MMPLKSGLWSRNFTLLITATILGAMGGIAGSIALTFLVYDETGSTLASALMIAIQIIPSFFIPLIAAPIMDRLPRKPFLVWGDVVNGVLYGLAGLYLLFCDFSYVGYLCFSLVLYCLSAFDGLAYDSIFPKLIPPGFEEKGYSVASTIYPILQIIMMPLAAILYKAVGVAVILLMQAGLSLLAAAVESGIRLEETPRMDGERFSLSLWVRDQRDTLRYLKKEKGLRSIFTYMAVTNGVGTGYTPILVAFFRTAPGYSLGMYALFSVAEFAGRTVGGALHYKIPIPVKRRFSFAFLVYQLYALMDILLLWLPFPLMMVNRGLCGFLGINSATMRQAAVQRYLPEEYRARVIAFESVLYALGAATLSLAVGALGEVLDYRLCMVISGAFVMAVCWATVWRRRKQVREIYNAPEEIPAEAPAEG